MNTKKMLKSSDPVCQRNGRPRVKFRKKRGKSKTAVFRVVKNYKPDSCKGAVELKPKLVLDHPKYYTKRYN